MSDNHPDASHGLPPELRSRAHRALLATAGCPIDTARIGSAFKILRSNLRQGLDPLVGGDAAEALFDRAVRLTADEFPWIVPALPKSADLSDPSSMDLNNVPDTRELANGLAATLAHTVALLISFLGADLVAPIVRRAWPVDSANNDRG